MIFERAQAERGQLSALLRWRLFLTAVVALAAISCALLGAAYAAVVGVQPTAVAYDYVAFDAASSKASDPFAGSEFVLQRMQGYAQLAGSISVLRSVSTNLGLLRSTSVLQRHVLVTTPPNSVLVQIKVTDANAAVAVRIADAVAKQAATVIESLEARGSGVANSPVHVVAISSGGANRAGAAVRYIKLTLLGLGLGLVLGMVLSVIATAWRGRAARSGSAEYPGMSAQGAGGVSDDLDPVSYLTDAGQASTRRRPRTGRRPSVTGVFRMRRVHGGQLERPSRARPASPKLVTRSASRATPEQTEDADLTSGRGPRTEFLSVGHGSGLGAEEARRL